MSQDDISQPTNHSYHYINIPSEELAHLPPDELLRACLEYRSLLQVITGVLTTPDVDPTVRLVTADLLYMHAQRMAKGQVPNENSPVTYDIKAVSQRLGLHYAEVRRAYEQIEELGGIHILDKWFPPKREQQLPLPLNAETKDKR